MSSYRDRPSVFNSEQLESNIYQITQPQASRSAALMATDSWLHGLLDELFDVCFSSFEKLLRFLFFH